MTRDQKLIMFYNSLVKGEKCRPCDLKDKHPSIHSIERDLNLLNSLGLVDRVIENGLIVWTKL